MTAVDLAAAWDHAQHVAEQWAGRGIPAFPIAISHDPTKYDGTGGLNKRPLTEHGHLDATTNPDELAVLFADARRRVRPGEQPGAGLCPGPAGYVQIDIDLKGGHNGYIAAANLGLQDTWGAKTPSGGEHRMWRKPDPTKWVGNSSPWAGIDIRSDAGWTVAPGTQTTWGAWSRNDIDDAQRWPDDVHTLPPSIWGRLDLHDTAPAVTHITAQHQRQLNDHLAATLHPDTLAAWEHLRDHHGAHSALWNVADGHTWLLVTRPGKRGWGASAYIGSREHGQIWNLSSSWPGVPAETALYLVNGQLVDQTAWHTHQLDQWAPAEPELEDDADAETVDELIEHVSQFRIDWARFWDNDHDDETWAIQNFLAEGRQHALFARGGQGKSLFTLAQVVPVAVNGTDVLYCDYEMTQSDLASRLEALGYGPETDLEHLHYLSLPSIPPLDTSDGGRTLVTYARHVNAKIVVVDTAARAIAGPEDKADTYRDLYKWTGIPFKRDGTTVLRIDHAGHQNTGAARGSSAKNDDVDVVWELKVADDVATLTARKTRMGWVPKKTSWSIIRGDILAYEQTNVPQWPEHTHAIATLLDKLDVPLDASYTSARDALPKSTPGRRKATVLAALRYRRERHDFGREP